MTTYALIYNRVSSDKQAKEGHGLESQNQRGRAYAASKNYSYETSFFDEGISGARSDRPAMKKLLDYIDLYKSKQFVVIIDDISRLARDVKVYLQLKTELVRRNVPIESPNFNFENSPEGFFIENIMAAKAQLDREQNARQVKQKMKARLELGYWCFRSPPLGLSYVKDPVHGKILKPVIPHASIYKEAILSYDQGMLNTLEEVRHFIEVEYKRHGINRPTSISGAQAILKELLYTGYIEYEKWGIKRMRGKHEGFIDIAVYERVREKLKGKAKLVARKDYNLDFPLRPLVLCDSCGKSLTAAWVHGRSKKYPRYWCKQKICTLYGKSIKRDVIEGQFETLLANSKPVREMIELTKTVLLDTWKNKEGNYAAEHERTQREVGKIEKQIEDMSDRLSKKLVENDEDLIKIYETQLKKLNKKLEKLKGTTPQSSYTTEQFRTASDKVMGILKEPVSMWKSDEYKDKMTIYAMYFDEKIRYDKNEGFRTATLALPIALMKEACVQKNSFVEMPRIERGSGETPIKKFS